MYHNFIRIIGRLTAIPEFRVTPKGNPVAQFTVAQNYRVGEGRSEVNYFECEAWDRFVKYLEAGGRKGRPVCVEGRIKTHRWTVEGTDQKRSKQLVVVEHFHYLDLIDAPAGEEKSDSDDPRLDQEHVNG